MHDLAVSLRNLRRTKQLQARSFEWQSFATQFSALPYPGKQNRKPKTSHSCFPLLLMLG